MVEKRLTLAERVGKARQIARMGLCSIASRNGKGEAKTVVVPGTDGKQYQVIIRRKNGFWTTECRLECGSQGYQDCPGNAITVCYHSFAAIFTAAEDSSCRVHSVTESLKAASRLKRLIKGKSVIRSLRSHRNGKWFHLVVIKNRKEGQL